MNTRSEEPTTRTAGRPGGRPRHRDTGEPDSAKRITFTVAAVVTFLFLLVTAGGLGWLLSPGGPASELTSGSEETGDPDGTSAGNQPSDDAPAPEGTVADPGSGLAYELPDGWERLGDDEVPQGYSSYVVLGSVEDPDAFVVTGSQRFEGTESLEETGLRLAADTAGTFVTGGGVPEVEPAAEDAVDGLPAFGASVGSGDGTEPYGRFVLVEMDDSHGAFVLGLNTDGGPEASDAVDEALDSVSTL